MISLLTLPVRLPLKAIVSVAEHLLATPPIPGVMLWQEFDQPDRSNGRPPNYGTAGR